MDSLNYHHLYYFWVYRQEGSFTKAAQRLKISQSVVSEQVAQLEKNLGIVLLDRTQKKNPQITETGRVVLDYAQSIFDTGQELLRWINTPEHRNFKQLRLGVQAGLARDFQIEFLKPILKQRDHKIEVVTGDQERLLRLLNDYKIDVILISSALDERFFFQNYAHPLASSPMCIVGRNNINKSAASVAKLLKDHPIYLPSVTLEVRVQIDAYFDRHNIKPHVAGEIDDIALLRLLALSTDAFVAIPKVAVIGDIKQKKLRLYHEFKDIHKRYYAITRERKFPNPITALLINEMKSEVPDKGPLDKNKT